MSRIGAALWLVLAAVLLSVAAGGVVAASPSGANHAAGSVDAVQAAEEPLDTYEVTALEAERIAQGREVTLEGFASGSTVEFEHENGDFRQRTADGGTVTFDTEHYETGEWTVSGPTADGENVTVGFAVVEGVSVDDRVWQGQTVTIEGLGDGTVVELTHEDGDFYQRLADDGSVTIDTTDLAAGEWTVTATSTAGEEITEEFTVAEQTVDLDARVGPSTDTAVLEVSSNRANFDLHLQSDALSAEAFAEAVDGEATVDGDAVVISVTDGERSIDVDGSRLAPGDGFEATATDTTASDVAILTGGDGDLEERDVRFVESTIAEEAGDVARIPLDVSGVDATTVNLSARDTGYYLNVEVTDLESVDKVTLEYDLWEAGREGDVPDEQIVSADAGTVSIGENRSFTRDDDSAVPGGISYTLYAIPGLSSENSDRTDRARLDVEERATDDLTVRSAPADLDPETVDSAAELANETTAIDTVPEDGYVVLEVAASGLDGYLLDDEGEWVGDRQGVNLTVEETDVGPLGGAATHSVAEDGADAIYTDQEDDLVYVVLHTDTIGLTDGDAATATFSVGEANVFVDDGREEVSGEFTVEAGAEAFDVDALVDDEGRLALPAAEGAQLHATTIFEPGTEIEVLVETQSEIRTETVDVQEDGTVSASFDFSDYEAGETVPAIEFFHFESDREYETEGVFVEPVEPVSLGEYEAQPHDGSDLYWDVTGDGDLTTEDVSVFQQHLFSDAVQNNPEAFNFSDSDDGSISHGDVVALFLETTGL